MAHTGDHRTLRWPLLGLAAALGLALQVAAETPEQPAGEAEAEDIEALIERMQMRLERMDEATREREERLGDVETRIERAEPSPLPAIPPAETPAPELEAAIVERDLRIERLEAELAELRARLAADPVPAEGSEARLIELQQELAAMRAQQGDLETRLDTALAEKRELEARLEAEAARARALEAELEQARAQLGAVDQETADAEPVATPPLQQVHELVRSATMRDPNGLVGLASPRPGNRLEAGQLLLLEVRVPEHDSYLQVDYFKADDRVVHLRSSTPGAGPHAAGNALLVGDPLDGEWLEIDAPFGEELVLVVASRSPLFDQPRPETEDARAYLTELAEALERQPTRPIAGTLALETAPEGG